LKIFYLEKVLNRDSEQVRSWSCFPSKLKEMSRREVMIDPK
jgi:hypothetical protein